MTRCVYLTFFGEYRGHGAPARVASRLDHGPLDRPRGLLGRSPGFLNAAPLGIEKFKEWVEPTRRVPARSCTPTSTTPTAVISVSIAVLGIGIAAYFWFQHEELGPLEGPHASATRSRAPATRSSSTSTTSTYLYENIIVAGDQGPDRPRRRTGSTRT